MRWTQAFIPTLKEDPAEAEIISHRLMLRAGLIRKVTSGVYSYLPLGWRALRKAAEIVRQEMDKAGAVEVFLPVLQPIELLSLSGRVADFGEDLFRLKDRHKKELVLGPTHEEVITDIVKQHINSYRGLPVNLYQIQTKFRDEVRPRGGVIRTKEFLMKDAYSFDVDEKGLDKSYQKMKEAYSRIFERAGLKCVVVEADPGVMGGGESEEFIMPSEAGEGAYVACEKCGYRAVLEKAAVAAPPKGTGKSQALKEVETPGMTTIAQVSEFLEIGAEKLVKTLIYLADGKPVAVLVRGDHEVNEAKLVRALGVKEISLADATTIKRVSGAPVGFAGPVGLEAPIVCDQAVAVSANFTSGANKADFHIQNINPGRDFKIERIADIRMAIQGDCCANCKAELEFARGIELGQIFKLGTRYSEALGATFLDAAGASLPMVMGCYGIGINRIIAAAIESSHDEAGIIWPAALAPYEALILPINLSEPRVAQAAEDIYKRLEEGGVEVLFDDREAAPGVKFKDADLIGIPVRITIGRHFLAQGELEIKKRWEKEASFCPLEEAVGRVKAILEGAQGPS
ncbi:MAG: prolyl-tRNA synthetase [Planctomycetes bacterium DG_23]|nr:MAG: prolyl-tRNA synthetase [Planctomycetes bacterium DG_23]